MAACLRPACDTWPLEGVGGVKGTGEAAQFYSGGYGSTGSMGCMPLGCFELKTVPPSTPSFFAGLSEVLIEDFRALGMSSRAGKDSEEPSPKSVVGFDFEAEVAAEQVLSADQAAWQEGRPTD